MTALAPYVRILGRGPGRARSLTAQEAFEAMQIILSGQAAPEALGALLMLMRYRGESPGEIAGFTRALRDALPQTTCSRPAVDWPSYAAGRSRGLPWFLLSARLVALAGHPVVLHGWNSHQSDVADIRRALPLAGIPLCPSLGELDTTLARTGIAYVALETLSPQLWDLLRLRDTFGLRSCLNTVTRMLNPFGAPLSVQGVFHPPYRALQRDAAALLEQPASLTLKGAGGEFERHPGKPAVLVGQKGSTPIEVTHDSILPATTRLAEGPNLPATPDSLAAVWTGKARDSFAEACVLGTAALVLAELEPDVPDPMARAQTLWDVRNKTRSFA